MGNPVCHITQNNIQKYQGSISSTYLNIRKGENSSSSRTQPNLNFWQLRAFPSISTIQKHSANIIADSRYCNTSSTKFKTWGHSCRFNWRRFQHGAYLSRNWPKFLSWTNRTLGFNKLTNLYFNSFLCVKRWKQTCSTLYRMRNTKKMWPDRCRSQFELIYF